MLIHLALFLFSVLPLGVLKFRKARMLRLLGFDIQKKTRLLGSFIIAPYYGYKNITIKENCFLNHEIRFASPLAKITVKANCQIGPRASFETVGHEIISTTNAGRDSKHLNIIVEENSWIGAGVIILGGVTIGQGSVVAAGSVVTKSCPPNSLVAGVPGKVIKRINVTHRA